MGIWLTGWVEKGKMREGEISIQVVSVYGENFMDYRTKVQGRYFR